MKGIIVKSCILIIFVVFLYRQDTPYFKYFEQADSPIIGVWEVVESENLPFEHISFCEELYLGTKFVFDYLGRVYVFKQGRKRYCNKEQFYYFRDSIVEISEYDMSFPYQILRLDQETLSLSSYDDNNLKLKRIAISR